MLTPTLSDPEHMSVAEIFEHYEQCKLRMLSKVPDDMMKPFREKAAKRVKTIKERGRTIEVVVNHRYGEEPCPNV